MPRHEDQSLILVVDDHIPAAEMVSHLFTMRGYETMCAFGGEEALEKAQQHLPDLILLDVMMPGMDGYQVLEALRENPVTNKIPIIFIRWLSGIGSIARKSRHQQNSRYLYHSAWRG
jgi:CheY-like chemotaxis protein